MANRFIGVDVGGTKVSVAVLDGTTMSEPVVRPTVVSSSRALVVGSSRVDLQACKLEYSIVSPK